MHTPFRVVSHRILLRTLFSLFIGSTLIVQNTVRAEEPAAALVKAARAQVGVTTSYVADYVVLTYPGGDVPMDRGVCSDVVIRAFRKLEIDLQKEVHEDMKRAFSTYPKTWGLKTTDRNIDHRRVLNLAHFFQRKGKSLPITDKPEDYLPGDIVAWRLPNNLPHIGIVAEAGADGIPRIIHNIGAGAREEDGLFTYRVIGHYRWWNAEKK